MHTSLSTCLIKAALFSTLLVAPMVSKAQYNNTSYGVDTLMNDTTGNDNSAFGFTALFNNTSGSDNSAFGFNALFQNTSGSDNSAFGFNALNYNTTGNNNSAFGFHALAYNFAGSNNSAFGFNALYSNTSGNHNIATGHGALLSNTTGSYNSANGAESLYFNTTGNDNSANGNAALYSNTKGSYNTANGYGSLYANTTGVNNTASGYQALWSATTGGGNTAAGSGALSQVTTGSGNVGLGTAAGSSLTIGSYNIDIAALGSASDSGIIRIGSSNNKQTFIAGISGVTASGGVAVYINANGQLGTLTSSRRFKRDIHTMGNLSDRLMQLRPVTFRYKDSAEKGPHSLQYGLIAEEVAKVYPDLVQYDKNGKPFTVYYHLLTPMLLNALQKEHRQNIAMNAAHKAEVAALKSQFAAHISAQDNKIAELQRSLGKLAAFVEASQNRAPVQKAVFVQH